MTLPLPPESARRMRNKIWVGRCAPGKAAIQAAARERVSIESADTERLFAPRTPKSDSPPHRPHKWDAPCDDAPTRWVLGSVQLGENPTRGKPPAKYQAKH
jgi:hypothetical protein